jgi:hypothetical protein
MRYVDDDIYPHLGNNEPTQVVGGGGGLDICLFETVGYNFLMVWEGDNGQCGPWKLGLKGNWHGNKWTKRGMVGRSRFGDEGPLHATYSLLCQLALCYVSD